MKKFLLILIAALSYFKAQADYEPTLLPELIDKSDLIFYGKIVAIQQGSVTAKALEPVKNHGIKMFRNAICCSKWHFRSRRFP